MGMVAAKQGLGKLEQPALRPILLGTRNEKSKSKSKSNSSFGARRQHANADLCTGGYWEHRLDKAIDSGSVIPQVTQHEGHSFNVDKDGGIIVLTSTGTTKKADGAGQARIQILAQNPETGETINYNIARVKVAHNT